jgi:hypothetical protein
MDTTNYPRGTHSTQPPTRLPSPPQRLQNKLELMPHHSSPTLSRDSAYPDPALILPQ